MNYSDKQRIITVYKEDPDVREWMDKKHPQKRSEIIRKLTRKLKVKEEKK